MSAFFDQLEAQLQTAAQAQTTGGWSRWRWLRSGMRAVPILAAVAVAVAVAVVGSTIGSHAHRVGRNGQAAGGTTSPATSNRAHTTSSGPPDCNAAGINDQQLREGTCVSGAQTVVVVNRGSVLHLQSLDARYVGFHRKGKFATFALTITNKLGRPEQWQHTQSALVTPGISSGAGNGPGYREDLGAETRNPNSCLQKTGTAANGGLQPGRSVTCDVIFHAAAHADPAARGSGLLIANFGEDVSNPSRLPVGTIRTFH